jgi:hypothetical protein
MLQAKMIDTLPGEILIRVMDGEATDHGVEI